MDTFIISAISGLLGVSVGALVSYFIARKQINASVISANRQNWINTLRDCISEFQSLVFSFSNLPIIENLEDEKNANILNRTMFLFHKIKLLINPNEEDHEQLIQLLDSILSYMIASDYKKTPDSIIDKLMKKLTSLSQTVLKREWERVKRGE